MINTSKSTDSGPNMTPSHGIAVLVVTALAVLLAMRLVFEKN